MAQAATAARPTKAPDAGVGGGGSHASSAPPAASSGADKPAHDVVAGAMARAASQSTIHPLDTMKVRMQAGVKGTGTASSSAAGLKQGSGTLSSSSGGSSSAASSSSGLQRGLTEVASLYRGVVSAATGAGVIIGAYFAFYSTSKRFLKQRTNWGEGQIAFVSGATAAVGSGVVKVPIAVCIRSVQAGVYPDVVAAARSITRAAGVRGLFTGYVPTLMEDVPDMAVKFAVYETLRMSHRRLRGREPSTLEDLLMGGSAGAAAAAATTPLDVVKTRMMCSASSRPSLMGAARSVLAEGDGARAFFRGVGPRALSNGLNSAVFFCFFEAIRRVLVRKQAEAAALQQQQQQQPADALQRQPLLVHSSGQQQQQGLHLQQQQQPILALGAAGSSGAASIHVGSSSSRQAPGRGSSSAGGSGRLACLSLALPIADWR